MHRRHFIAASFSFGTAALLGQTSATEGDKKPEPKMTWHDPQQWGVEGRAWPDQQRQRYYDRLPASAEGKVTKAVWGLSRQSAGMAVRFKSNSSTIQVRYRVMSPELAKPHIPATGASGVDLYARDASGNWRWVGVSKPTGQEISATLASKIPKEPREWMIYLPLFNGVETLEIGVEEGATFEGLPPRDKGLIVFYGTSITHGACASRPGMTHVAILGRRLDRPTLNLGFSGNGRMDEAVGDFLVQLDSTVFVIDCLPNMGPAEVTERTIPLVKQLRAARPETPILLVESRRNTDSWISPSLQTLHSNKHNALKVEFEKLKKEGVQQLFYLGGNDLLGDDADASTDGSHPSDLGFYRQADAFEPVLRDILKR
jgi:hypothetical protein